MHYFAAAFVTVIYATTCLGDNHFAEQYPFSLTLSENEYYLYWNFSQTDETIQFAVRVKTTGWVGFGISPNGQMPGSDVVIGWVDGDKSYFHDRYAEGRFLPAIDNMQDWYLISASSEDGYTELEFSRNFTTCDNESKDLNIEMVTSRIVYAWNDNKPTVIQNNDGSETYSIQMHQSLGTASSNLLSSKPTAAEIPDDALQFKVQVSNVEIPSDTDTTYWCRGVSGKDLIENLHNETKYLIKMEPYISEESKAYVHHLIVFSCNGLDESTDDLGPGGDCYSSESSIGIQSCRANGGILFGAWAVGGEGFTFPDNVAYPFGGTDGYHYFLIEMHFNNPNRHVGVIDSSGLLFTFLNNPREHDAGIMLFGQKTSHNTIIPPGSNNYTIPTFCPATCTNHFIPETGIKIFGNGFHTHLAGVGLSLSVLRQNSDGTYKEIRPIETNLKYDFNYQQIIRLPEEITLMPGDVLSLKCYYNTSSRSNTTLGGKSTIEEMCISFPIYYPRTNLRICESTPWFHKLTDFAEDNLPPQNLDAFIELETSFKQNKLQNALDQVEWNETLRNTFYDYIYGNATQYSYCFSDVAKYDHTALLPNVTSYYSSPAPVRNCSAESSSEGNSGNSGSIVHGLSFLTMLAVVLSYFLLN